MNNIMAVGKFLDQPRLVGKFSQSVPTILAIGGGLEVSKHLKETQKNKRKDEFIKSTFTLAGTMGTALVATRGMKPRKIGKFLIKGFNGLSKKIDLKELSNKNTTLVNDFLKGNKVSEKTQEILEKSKTKILKLKEVKTIFSELSEKKNGKEFLNKLIPEPENISSHQIFSEIKRLSIMGLVPVLGGIIGGTVADKVTDKKWKEKVPNKIKEGTYQYLANIFLCNVGAGLALGALEKAKITSKSARAIGMTTGIVTTGIIGGSAIANFISKKCIDPLLGKKNKSEKLYSERKPEMLDIGLHTDDIATVAVLSGLKWIEPALPVLYSISGYRAGIGYRNGKEKEK